MSIYAIAMTIIAITSTIVAFAKNIKDGSELWTKLKNKLFYKEKQAEKIDRITQILEENNKKTDETCRNVAYLTENMKKMDQYFNDRVDNVEVLLLKQIIWNPNTSLEERCEAGRKYVEEFHRNSATKALYLELNEQLKQKEKEMVQNQIKNKK